MNLDSYWSYWTCHRMDLKNAYRACGIDILTTQQMIENGFTKYFLEKHKEKIRLGLNYNCFEPNLYNYQKAMSIKTEEYFQKTWSKVCNGKDLSVDVDF